MLVDVKLKCDPITNAIAELCGNPTEVVRLAKGVYLLGHFSLDHLLPHGLTFNQHYPALGRISKFMDQKIGSFNSYGVCDNYKQVLKKCPMIIKSRRKFVMSVTPIEKSKQSPQGGWRWHKWGPYIGTQKPSGCEYLYDEPKIERVYCYKVIEVGKTL